MRSTWLYSLLLFMLYLPALGQQKIRPDNQIAWPPTCTTIGYVYSPSDNACIAGGPPGPPGSTTTGIDVTTRGADPTGLTDSSAVLTTTCAGNPNGTLFLPQGTYLLAATSNLSLASNCNVYFANGAQVKTGNQGAATITSINRTRSYEGTQTINLSACTSAVTTIGSEVFTNCPHAIPAGEIVILTGLTNVPNCYFGCLIASVGAGAAAGTTFTVTNAAATGLVTAATETGSAILQAGNLEYYFASLTCQSSSGSGIISITGCPNALPASPTLVQLLGTTHVRAGTYVLIPSSVTSTSFNLVCTVCTTVTSGLEPAGEAIYNTGGLTYVHFSAPVTGLPAVGFYSPQTTGPTAGAAQFVISGTTNYNGPYWITTIADSQDIGLLDMRSTAATESAGTGYIPYVVTMLGSVQAPTGQQIVQHGSGVTFQGVTKSYVGWYGAQGGVISSDDSQSIQEALFWNAGRWVVLPRIGLAAFGFANNAAADYNLTHSVQMYGNKQHIDGEISSVTWSGGTVLNCNMIDANEPCLISRPDTASVEVSNLALDGPSANCAVPTAALVPDLITRNGPDGWDNGSGESVGWNIRTQCLLRDGIHLVSAGAGFNSLVSGAGGPDYFHLTSLESDANGAYGVSAWLSDSNAGVIDGNSDFRNTTFGGVYCEAQVCPTLVGINGEGDTPSFAAGTTFNIQSLSVTGSGYNAQCTGQLTVALPAAFSVNKWIIIAGTDGSGGLAGTDNAIGTVPQAWQINSINSVAGTFTFTCAGASGGPGSTGTAKTADGNSMYNSIAQYRSGSHGNPWTFSGTGVGQGQVSLGGYIEATSGCPYGSSLILGSQIPIFVTANECNGNPASNYPQAFTGAAINVATGGGLAAYAAYLSLINYNYNSGSMSLSMTNGQGGAGNGNAFTGTTQMTFAAGSHTDWAIQELPTGNFRIEDVISGDNNDIMEVQPNAGGLGGNIFYLTGPSTTGTICLQCFNTAGVSTGNVNYYAASGFTSIGKTTGVATIKVNQQATKDFAGTCTMATGTSCTFSLVTAYTSTPVCVVTPVTTTPANVVAGACSVSSTTVTITAATSNSLVWNAVLIGNPN